MHKERGREDCHNSHCLHDSRRLHTTLTNKFDVHGHKQYPGHIAKVNSEENNQYVLVLGHEHVQCCGLSD